MQYPLAAISEVLVKQSVTSLLVESLVECLNDRLVKSFCGKKHAHGNGNRQFQYSARCTRSPETITGEHTFTLDYVEDIAANDTEQSHFRPVEKLIQFDGKKRYQEDISAWRRSLNSPETRPMKVTTLSDTESLAVLDVQCHAQWRHDTKAGPQVVRRTRTTCIPSPLTTAFRTGTPSTSSIHSALSH